MDRLKHALASFQHALAAVLAVVALALPAQAQPPPPALTGPVNDFANVIDGASKRTLEEMILSLERASGDAIVVATVDTYKPDYADLKEYAVKMFENRGRGIGQKGKDNGAAGGRGRPRPGSADRGGLRAGAVRHRRLRRPGQPPRHGPRLPAGPVRRGPRGGRVATRGSDRGRPRGPALRSAGRRESTCAIPGAAAACCWRCSCFSSC